MSVARRLTFSPRARRDLREIVAYIADQSGIEVANGYVDRLERAIGDLRDFPEAGRLLRKGYRRLGFERRITVIYRLQRADVRVARVLYGGRDSSLNVLP